MSNFASDGPNYEAVFRGMKCLHGGNAEDVKIIVRFLKFYQGTEEFQRYLDHYLPMLSDEVAAEFKPKKVKVKVEEAKEEVKEEPMTIVGELEFAPISAPKKKGRSAK